MVKIEKVVSLPAKLDPDFFTVRKLVITGKASTSEELERYPFLQEYPCPAGFRREGFLREWDVFQQTFTIRFVDREQPTSVMKE